MSNEDPNRNGFRGIILIMKLWAIVLFIYLLLKLIVEV